MPVSSAALIAASCASSASVWAVLPFMPVAPVFNDVFGDARREWHAAGRKSRRPRYLRGLLCMRRRGLEPPPGYPGPGPQPGASTNSAIGARAVAQYSPRELGVESVRQDGYLVRTHVRPVEETAKRMDIGKDLTKRQQEIFDFIKRYSARHGYPPTVRDIGKAVGLASSSTVHAHLANLERIGLLRRDPSKPRAIEMLDRAVDGVKSIVRPNGLPLVGQVAAGQPILAEENIEDYVQVPELAGGEDGEFILRVRGESMKNAGILEGDFVVVRPQETATDGDIVVAMVGEEATVKRFFTEDDHIRLQPENETMEPIR